MEKLLNEGRLLLAPNPNWSEQPGEDCQHCGRPLKYEARCWGIPPTGPYFMRAIHLSCYNKLTTCKERENKWTEKQNNN